MSIDTLFIGCLLLLLHQVEGWAISLADACLKGGHEPPLGASGLDKVERVHERDAMLQASTAECITGESVASAML